MRIWAFVMLFTCVCCSSHDRVAVPVVPDYFPMRTGAWFIYAVDSVVTEQGISTEYTYDLQIQVKDSFPNSGGDYTYVLQRSKRANATAPWSASNTWSARLNDYEAIVMEGNTPFVKIMSPLQNGKTWNGNQLNDLGGTEACGGSSSGCDNYTIRNFDQPYTVEGVNFPHTLSVAENDDEDKIVYYDVRTEIYARSVGLVYREVIQLQYCDADDCRGQQTVDQGLNYKQSLKQYGGL